jgi:hypothetical protein
MALEGFEKQGYEEFTVAANFSANMTVGETISTQTATATDNTGTDKTATVLNVASLANSGQKVTVLARAGVEAESPYKITLKCVTSLGHKWEKDIQMKIKEK